MEEEAPKNLESMFDKMQIQVVGKLKGQDEASDDAAGHRSEDGSDVDMN